MKFAILHSSLDRAGGDITFCYNLAKELNADIYTNKYDENINDSYKGIYKYVRPPNFEITAIRGLDKFEHIIRWIIRKDIDADFYIYSSAGPSYHTILDKTPYLYYCHTPNRSLYDLYPLVRKYHKTKGLKYSILGKMKMIAMKLLDQSLHRFVINPNQVVTNSELVYKRYVDVYNKTPRCVINPPINIGDFYNCSSEDYYLTVNRLEQKKRIDWQVKAFSGGQEKLLIVGDGPERMKLEKLAKKCRANVAFKGNVSDRELKRLYAKSKAFIFSAIREDFGIVPVEALASGKPVICINEGGPLEYLNPKNSILFSNLKELREIIHWYRIEDFESMKFACLDTAKQFDSKVIAEKIKETASEILDEFY